MSAISSDRCEMSASAPGGRGGRRSANLRARSPAMAARIGHGPGNVNDRVESPSMSDLRRLLPSVEQVLQRPEVRALEDEHGRAAVVREVRALVEEARTRAAEGDRASLESAAAEMPGRLAERLSRARRPSLVPVINATGVVVHTNLGRAPLP